MIFLCRLPGYPLDLPAKSVGKQETTCAYSWWLFEVIPEFGVVTEVGHQHDTANDAEGHTDAQAGTVAGQGQPMEDRTEHEDRYSQKNQQECDFPFHGTGWGPKRMPAGFWWNRCVSLRSGRCHSSR